MIFLQFTVYDQKAAAYLPPFILPRAEQALRTFSDCCQSNDHQFGNHPEDYTLFRLGTFNDETGEIVSELAPIVIANGLELAALKPPTDPNNEPTQTQVGDETLVQHSPAGQNSA